MPRPLTDAEHYPPCDFVRAVVDAECGDFHASLVLVAVGMRASPEWLSPSYGPERGHASLRSSVRGVRVTQRGESAYGEIPWR